jgi:FkbM family methyltransferase
MKHHPIFDEIPGHTGHHRENVLLDYVGARFLAQWDGRHNIPANLDFRAPKPVFDEEYFEWVDLLESVRDCRGDRYVMMELGAGYGRWGVRAGVLARARGIRNIHLRFCEGEPKHAGLLKEALKLNDITDESILYENAMTYTGQPVPFMVSHRQHENSTWYGQGIGWHAGEGTGETYYGKQVFLNDAGYGHIYVSPITLEEMMADLEVIDLIDMDLQGAEREVIQHSMDALTRKVKRVHIGTHANDIEDKARAAFAAAGWRNVWDFGTQKINTTPYGEIRFVDGVQGWINPKLS